MELFSDKFITTLKEHKDDRAAASEMEHAIRKHCKVNEADDPVMYKRFSEKLDDILKKYNEQWDQMLLHLETLREEIDQGRGDDSSAGDPFTDLIIELAFDGSCLPSEMEAVKSIIEQILEIMADKIEGLNFWDRPNMVDELEGKIQEVFILSDIPALEESFELVTTELLNLAKRRELDILSNRKQQDGN